MVKLMYTMARREGLFKSCNLDWLLWVYQCCVYQARIFEHLDADFVKACCLKSKYIMTTTNGSHFSHMK